MNIRKHSQFLLYGCWICVLLLSGCSSQSHHAKDVALEQIGNADEAEAVLSDFDKVIQQANTYYDEGIEHYKHHRWEDAHQQFDSALEILLEADMDAETHYRLTETYDKLFAQIHKLELEESYRDGLAQDDVREEAENSDELEAFLSTTRPEFLEEESSSTSIFENPEGTLGEITIDESDELVMKYVKEFTKDHSQYRKGLERATDYLPTIVPILKAHKLPVELAFIPLIESNFKVEAVSPAGAVGLWQFVRSTGKNYDLRIDSSVDERRDPKKSSEAAAEYWKDLYGMLGDWDLAFAGYYMGEYKVHNAIGRHRTRDIEELAETRAFGNGARHYVARIKAAILVAKRAEEFGLPPLEIHPISSIVVDVKRGSELKQIAQQLGISYDDLRHLNPELKQGKIPAGSGTYALRIPKSAETVVLAQQLDFSTSEKEPAAPVVVASQNKEAAKKETAKKEKSSAKTSEEYLVHRVQKGENPSIIAKKYHVSVEDIRRANSIRNVKSLQVGQKLKIPTNGKNLEMASATKTISHKIRKGDTLASIAQQYHVSVETLKSYNRIKKANRLQVGQIIKVPAKSIKVASATGTSSDKKMRTYRVKRGDSLSKIAASFGVSVSQLQQWNNFDSGTLLHPGSRITVWY